MGVSPLVGGLLGSATCSGLPNGVNGFRGNVETRGENRPSTGVGGDSTNRIPATSECSCRGLFVIVSARGDIRASSSIGNAPGKRAIAGESAGSSCFVLENESRMLGNVIVWNPKLP